MNAGYARFQGANDGPAASRDKEESPRLQERRSLGKTRILDELVELTGWPRYYARAALREAPVLKVIKPPPGRTPVYGPVLLPPLIKCLAVLRAPAGRLPAPMLPVLVPLLRGHEELQIADDQAALLMRMSAATIDHKLAGDGRNYSRTDARIPNRAPC